LGAAVTDGQFAAVHFHEQIGDAHAKASSQQVFNGLNRNPVFCQHDTPTGVYDERRQGRDVNGTSPVGDDKDNPVPLVSRVERHSRSLARV
jgi:hypothetical protein